eukprot:CAMPEP_0185186060 /NCGR_PEP_ID=MMETSP1140-20130426/3764_1 /TAXON_ID=298111 /ORGANISM="Pavlova sp., Strain CCMP459" /LENGTH=261 /DNA_ID=CAMNT_0027752313 /DNA_START=92 /DNA_END=874 /DNA_ORIENTATION=+
MFEQVKQAVGELHLQVLKRFCKFVLVRLLGRFIATEIDLQKLNFEVASGTAELDDLQIDARTINALLGDTPLSFISGTIGKVRMAMPWRGIINGEAASIRLSDVRITLAPSAAGPALHGGARGAGATGARMMRSSVVQEFSTPSLLAKSMFADEEEDAEAGEAAEVPAAPTPSGSSGGAHQESSAGADEIGSSAQQMLRRMIGQLVCGVHVRVERLTVRVPHEGKVLLLSLGEADVTDVTDVGGDACGELETGRESDGPQA